MHAWKYTVALIAASTLLSGCGIKPGNLKAPSGSEEEFPRTYPDTRTDPAPEKMMRRL